MAFCNLPSHANRIARVNVYRKTEGKPPLFLPAWAKNEEGQPPREMHIQIFSEGELEVEWLLRPCRTCLKRLIHIYLQLNFEELKKTAPALAGYIHEAPDFMTREDVQWEREYRGIRKWVRLAIEEFEKYRMEQRQKK